MKNLEAASCLDIFRLATCDDVQRVIKFQIGAFFDHHVVRNIIKRRNKFDDDMTFIQYDLTISNEFSGSFLIEGIAHCWF